MDCVVSITCSCGKVLTEKFAGHIWNYHDCQCKACGKVYEISRPRIEYNASKPYSEVAK